MVRINKNNKGISCWKKEFKISQYVDGTFLFLDGTAGSRTETLVTLDKFYSTAGLKINREKTKAVWIGKPKKNDILFVRIWNYTIRNVFCK